MAVNDRNSIFDNANFKALVHERTRFGVTLTIVMLVIYYGFILLVAFGKGFLATKIGGGVTPIGMIIGLFVILSAVVLTGIYTQRGHSRHDEHTEKLRRDMAQKTLRSPPRGFGPWLGGGLF